MLAIIAGQGDLPLRLAAVLDAEKTPFHLCELDGFPAKNPLDRPVIGFRIERLGSFLQELTARGVTDVVFAGAIKRPPLDPSLIDAATMPLVPRMMAALQAGDDGALRTVLAIFEEAGFKIRGAHEIAPQVLPASGVLTDVQPGATNEKDAARGAAIVAALAAVDVGQSCVVAKGQALAIEALGGTDWMLRSLLAQPDQATAMAILRKIEAEIPDGTDLAAPLSVSALPMSANFQGRSHELPAGGVVFKAPKTGQDRRIDLPTIGPATVLAAAEAGLEGIVIEAGGVIVLDPGLAIAIANAFGLFLWVRPKEIS